MSKTQVPEHEAAFSSHLKLNRLLRHGTDTNSVAVPQELPPLRVVLMGIVSTCWQL